jgi:phosphatidylserine decarboxylase
MSINIKKRYAFCLTILCVIAYLRNDSQRKLKVSFTRRVSQLTSVLTNTTLPPYIRAVFYKTYGTFTGVKFEEAVVQDLNSFCTFNQFFTRQLREGLRPIAEPLNDFSLVSPCDGTVLSVGDVNERGTMISCVKGKDYRLDEFLFGYKTSTKDVGYQESEAVDKMLAEAQARGNKIVYMVVYLSPGDYHRFHSPANFTANFRRHIAGYLYSVNPGYLEIYKDVLK